MGIADQLNTYLTLSGMLFAIGTFGLGLTLGGLIFGRWRRA